MPNEPTGACIECGGLGEQCICDAADREGIVNGAKARDRRRRRRKLVTDGGTDPEETLAALIEAKRALKRVDRDTLGDSGSRVLNALEELDNLILDGVDSFFGERSGCDGHNLVTDGGEDAHESGAGRDGYGFASTPDPETAADDGVLLDLGEGRPETVREVLSGRPHGRGSWAKVDVLLPTALVERILLDTEETDHETVAGFMRTAVNRYSADLDRQAEHEVMVDIPVPDRVWERASLDAAMWYQLGRSHEGAFQDAMMEAVAVHYNYHPEGAEPGEGILHPEDLPIDADAFAEEGDNGE